MKTQNVVVDIGNLKASDIFFVQGEQGREITFKVINSLLEDFVNLAGYTATIHILKSDGNFTIDTMTIDSAKNECYYTLTENDCACGGRGFYDLSFSKNDELIYTAHGDFVGDFRSVNDDSVASVSSAYGVTFPEGFQQKLIAGDKIHINGNVISADGEIYYAGDNINISVNNVISATDTKYSAGDNISINENNVINAVKTYKQEILFYSQNGYTTQGEIPLLKSILLFDEIEIIFGISTNANHTRTSVRINAQYFYETFKYTTRHADPNLSLNYWNNMAVDVSLGINDNPSAIHTHNMYGVELTAIYQINGINY